MKRICKSCLLPKETPWRIDGEHVGVCPSCFKYRTMIYEEMYTYPPVRPIDKSYTYDIQ
jgi:hypothetical protein